MTKKDYNKFASMLTNRLNSCNTKAEVNVVLRVMRDMQVLFTEDNPNFSAVRFENAVYENWNKYTAYMNVI